MTALVHCRRCRDIVWAEEVRPRPTSAIARYRDEAGHRISAPTNPTNDFLGLDRSKRK